MTSSLTRFEDFEQFGTKLFSQISRQKDGKNFFLSPVSIALAMSMCTVGARHETLQQMLHALEVLSREQLTKITEQIMRILSLAYPNRKVQLKLANRLYAQKTYKLQQEYLNLVLKFCLS
jgi:serine protease inhibitor